MLNGHGEMQRVIVLGGKSDLALSILDRLPIAADSEIFLCGRNMEEFSTQFRSEKFNFQTKEMDFTDIEFSSIQLRDIFMNGDIDLVIFAYAILGDENLQLDPVLFNQVLITNFYSQAILLNEVFAKLAIQKHGQILLISSVAGIRPRRRNFVYGVSKFGVDFIAQGLQKICSKDNIKITILRPGFVHTKMTLGLPAAPFATNISNVAEIAIKGLRRNKRIVYAPKILNLVVFLLKLMPERVFRVIDR